MSSLNKWTEKNMKQILEKASKKALRTIGIVIGGQAKLMVQVQTGRLAGSVTYATKEERQKVDSPAIARDAVSQPTDKDTVHIGTNVEYAPYQEYGTKYSGAQPFLRPAFDRNRKNVQKIYAKEIKAALRG